MGGAFCKFCKSNFVRKECLEQQMSKYANFQDVQANYKAFCHGHENIWLKNWKWVTLPHISRSFVECKVIFWVLWNKKAANTYQTKKHLWHCFLYDCLLIFRHFFSKNAEQHGKLDEKSQKNGCLAAFGTTPSWPGQCFGATQKYDLQLIFYLNFVHFFRHFQCFGVFFRR